MQETLSFLQQQLMKMTQTQPTTCKRCDQLIGQLHTYRQTLMDITDEVDEREKHLERRDKEGEW